jgi:hypothetical protein
VVITILSKQLGHIMISNTCNWPQSENLLDIHGLAMDELRDYYPP